MRSRFLASLTGTEAHELAALFSPMPHQFEPDDPWAVWILQWGRGSGKTYTAAQYVRERIDANQWRVVNVAGPTWTDTLRTMVNGNERAPGLLGLWPPHQRPFLRLSQDDPHLRCWNGARINLFAAKSADRFRGANADGGWADEIDYWRPALISAEDAFADFQFGIRTGPDPRIVASTTPRRGGLVAKLRKLPGVVVTRASMLDNLANLSADFVQKLRERTTARTWRQEALGELLPDVEGAIVSAEMLDRFRLDEAPPLVRVVVGVDPYGGGGDACGVCAVGRGADGHAFVLADRTCRLGPDGWGRVVIETALAFNADAIAVESNYGGNMALAVISHAADALGVERPRFAGKGGKGIASTRAKHERFERTTGAKYERGELHHVGHFAELEDEVTQFTPSAYMGESSPNRADALVLAVEELFPVRKAPGWDDVLGVT